MVTCAALLWSPGVTLPALVIVWLVFDSLSRWCSDVTSLIQGVTIWDLLNVSIIVSIATVVDCDLNLLVAKVLHSEKFELVARLERLVAHELIAVGLLLLCLYEFLRVKKSSLSLVCFWDFAPCPLCLVLRVRVRSAVCWCDCGHDLVLQACVLTYPCCLSSFASYWRRLVGNHLDQDCLSRPICLQLEFVGQGWGSDSITSSLNLRVVVYQPLLTFTLHLNMLQVFRASCLLSSLVPMDVRVRMGLLVLWFIKAFELPS